MRKIISRTLIALMFIPGLCQAGEVDIKRLNAESWIFLETDTFQVLTNAGEKQGLAMVQELENFRYFMAELLGYEQKHFEAKVPIVLAKNKKSFVALGIPDNYAGLFTQDEGVGYAIFARADGFKASVKGGGSWGRSVVLHELVHLLMNNSSLGLASPPWYNEGIAEYFATYMQKGDEIILGDMRVLGDRFYDMARMGGAYASVDTDSLFRTTQADLQVGKGQGKLYEIFMNKFYARSASVVHYLNADPGRRQQLFAYLRRLNMGMSIDDAFARSFNTTFKLFDDQVDRYIAGKSLLSRVFPVGKGGIEFPVVKSVKQEITARQALEFMYPRIIMYSDTFLGAGGIEKLNADLENLYSDFFAQDGSTPHSVSEARAAGEADAATVKCNTETNAKNWVQAKMHCEKAYAMNQSALTANNLGWLYAVAKHPDVVNAKEALPLAEKAVKESSLTNASFLDTLAAAYAVNEDFASAVKAIELAIELSEGDEKKAYQEVLEAYKSGKVYY